MKNTGKIFVIKYNCLLSQNGHYTHTHTHTHIFKKL